MNAPCSIPASTYANFMKAWDHGDYSGQRMGQAFFNYFRMQKLNPTPWASVLYNATDRNARKMIESAVDWSN